MAVKRITRNYRWLGQARQSRRGLYHDFVSDFDEPHFGHQNVNNSLVRVARSFGARDLKTFATVAILSSLTFIIVSLRQTVVFGLVGVTVGELFASQSLYAIIFCLVFRDRS